MTKEQEAQQAQTIAETSAGLRSYIWARYRWTDAPKELTSAANLIDSQAQKIADQATVIEEMHAHTVTLNALYLQAEDKIAEQAKEIERLKDLVRKTSGVEPDPYSVVVGGPGAPGYDGEVP